MYGSTPAPAVDVILEWGGRRRMVRALIDTGASGTLLRLAEYVDLRLQKIGDAEDVGGVGGAGKANPTVVNLTFEGILLPNFPVMAWTTHDLQVTLIGRDILNRYVLECNGPALEFEIR
jgi:predicted aspartyl protease